MNDQSPAQFSEIKELQNPKSLRTKENNFCFTCKWTGMNLKVIKSHIGQYITPLNNVGNKSRFKRSRTSPPFSPEIGNHGSYLDHMNSKSNTSCSIEHLSADSNHYNKRTNLINSKLFLSFSICNKKNLLIKGFASKITGIETSIHTIIQYMQQLQQGDISES